MPLTDAMGIKALLSDERVVWPSRVDGNTTTPGEREGRGVQSRQRPQGAGLPFLGCGSILASILNSMEGVMAKINKVGHVVLGCRDPQSSIKFYTENLGWARGHFNQHLQMASSSLGGHHHDIAATKCPIDHPRGRWDRSNRRLHMEGGDAE